MAALNERINNIKQYFKGCNVASDSTFVLVSFPKTWKTFDEETLNNKYNVFTGQRDEGMYFITETANGTDCIFDAIEYTIKLNQTFEEKQALLQIKANELAALFVTEPLEKLKTLEFTFAKTKQPRKYTKKVTATEEPQQIVEETPTVVETDTVVEKQVENEEQEQVVNEEKTTKKNNKKTKKTESSTMSFIKGLTNSK